MDSLLKEAFLAQDFEAKNNAALLEAVSESTLKTKGIIFWLTHLKPYFLNGWVVFAILGITSIFLGTKLTEQVKYSPTAYEFGKVLENKEQLEKVNTQGFVISKTKVEKQKAVSKAITPYKIPKQIKEVKTIRRVSPEKEFKQIPVLSDDEIKEHNKNKKQFVKFLMKSAGQSMLISMKGIDGKPNTSYYLKQTEVTNAQYRLFLNDLILQGKKEDYLMAIIDTTGWTKAYDYEFFKPLDQMYHWHPAYDDYPVVNISVPAAKLYCKWVTQEIQLLEKNKLNVDLVRLPTESEWENAASVGGKMSPYPWGGPYVRNSKGNYLANFKPGKDTLSPAFNEEYSKDDIKLNDDYKSNPFAADGGLTTVKVYEYYPNENRLFNMAGNVAEMVANNKTGKIGLKGGSWADPMKYMKIKTPLRFEDSITSHPTVGFRYVVTIKPVESDSKKANTETVNPSLTAEQKKDNFKRKEVMLKHIIKLNHDFYTLSKKGTMTTPDSNLIFIKPISYKKHEVSNIEYKTFLFDLIIQKRYEEFFVAKPNEELWRNVDGINEPYVEYYFTHPAYIDYPVVNITKEGADLFCKWLLEEMKKSDYKNRTSRYKSIRIPTAGEWTFASSYQGQFKVYPWGGNNFDIENKDGSYSALANWNVFDKDYYENNKNENFTKDLRYVYPTSSNPENPYGIYNLAGNVAEIVKYQDGEYGSKGGSWQSNSEQIKIYVEDSTKGKVEAGPTVGFRFVIEFNSNETVGLIKDLGRDSIQLSKTQIIANNQRKGILLGELITLNEYNYSDVLLGSQTIEGKTKSLRPFIMSKFEVTNADYKTFLFDLIIQERYEDYHKAKIKTEAWKLAMWKNASFADYYFSHHDYRRNPVLNINVEGAEMYCAWLFDEINKGELPKSFKSRSFKENIRNIRLPIFEEWVYAASFAGENKVFPWPEVGYRRTDNKYKGNMLANFTIPKSERQANRRNGSNPDDIQFTAFTGSYWPNQYGIFNLSGNAAEIVKYENGDYGTKGGSYESNLEQIKIYASDTTKGHVVAGPTIGFRFVIEFENKTER